LTVHDSTFVKRNSTSENSDERRPLVDPDERLRAINHPVEHRATNDDDDDDASRVANA
jgi:hypothetical protein